MLTNHPTALSVVLTHKIYYINYNIINFATDVSFAGGARMTTYYTLWFCSPYETEFNFLANLAERNLREPKHVVAYITNKITANNTLRVPRRKLHHYFQTFTVIVTCAYMQYLLYYYLFS